MEKVINQSGIMRKLEAACDEYPIGTKVYLITDEEQRLWIVMGYSIRPPGVAYILHHKAESSYFYGNEFTKEKNVIF